jgi:hypothetical protein
VTVLILQDGGHRHGRAGARGSGIKATISGFERYLLARVILTSRCLEKRSLPDAGRSFQPENPVTLGQAVTS